MGFETTVNESIEPFIKENELIMILTKIIHRRWSASWVYLSLAMIFMLSAVLIDTSYAQGRYMREEWKVPEFYPKGFDGYGKIEVIENDRVVVDDIALKFSRHIRFATPRDSYADISSFSVGDTVAYVLNEKREVVSLWYIESRKPR